MSSLQWLQIFTGFPSLLANSHHYLEIRSTAFHLTELGISTPDPSEIGYEEGAWKPFLEELGNLAERGLLTRARKRFGGIKDKRK